MGIEVVIPVIKRDDNGVLRQRLPILEERRQLAEPDAVIAGAAQEGYVLPENLQARRDHRGRIVNGPIINCPIVN